MTRTRWCGRCSSCNALCSAPLSAHTCLPPHTHTHTPQVRQSVEPFKVAGYVNFQYRHDIDQKRRRQLDSAFRRPNDVLARERDLIRELRAIEGQIKKLQARGVAGGATAAPGGSESKPAAPAAHGASAGGAGKGGAAPLPRGPAQAGSAGQRPRAPPIVVASASVFLDDPTGDSAFALDDLFPAGCGPMGSLFGRPHAASKKRLGSAPTPGKLEVPTAGPSDVRMTDDVSDSASEHTQETVSLPDPAELMAIRTLATKTSAPYRFPAGASRAAVVADPAAGVAGSASSGNPFAGVSLRSVQMAAPIDGLHPDSRTLAKANGLLQVCWCCSRERVKRPTRTCPAPRRPCRFLNAPCHAPTSSLH